MSSLVKIFPRGARHTNNKLAAGIFPPRSLTREYDWLTKITWDIAHAIPRVGEKFWVLFRVLLKKLPQQSAEKLFVSLFCLLRSFSKDLSTGKRYFVLVVENCVSALWASNRGQSCFSWSCMRVVSRRLLQANLDGTVCIYAEQFQHTPRSELRMKIKFFNESHSLWGEVVLVTAK